MIMETEALKAGDPYLSTHWGSKFAHKMKITIILLCSLGNIIAEDLSSFEDESVGLNYDKREASAIPSVGTHPWYSGGGSSRGYGGHGYSRSGYGGYGNLTPPSEARGGYTVRDFRNLCQIVGFPICVRELPDIYIQKCQILRINLIINIFG